MFIIKQRERKLKATLGVNSARSSSTTQQGHSDQTRANMNSRLDETSADDRQLFAEVLTPPPMIGSAAYNQVNPTLGDALLQNPSALREISRSSQDNLKACADNTAEPPNMFVPPPSLLQDRRLV